MPVEIYVLHAGVGQNRAVDGPSLKKREGSNFAFIEQSFPAGVLKSSFFQGIIVPPNLDTFQDVEVRTVWRQIDAGLGDVVLDVGYRTITPPDNRDSAVLTQVSFPLAGVPKTLTGVVGEEIEHTFLIAGTSFASGEEMLLSVRRAANDVLDTFLGAIGLVLIELRFTQTSAGGGGGFLYENITGQVDGITNTFTVPSYTMGANNLRVFRNGVMEDPATVTQVDPTTIQLSVVPALLPTPEYLDVHYLPL